MRFPHYHSIRKSFTRSLKLNLQTQEPSSSKSKWDEDNYPTNRKKLEIKLALKSVRNHQPNNRINKSLNRQTGKFELQIKPLAWRNRDWKYGAKQWVKNSLKNKSKRI